MYFSISYSSRIATTVRSCASKQEPPPCLRTHMTGQAVSRRHGREEGEGEGWGRRSHLVSLLHVGLVQQHF